MTDYQPAAGRCSGAPTRGTRRRGTLWRCDYPKFRSPIARAVMPVLGGHRRCSPRSAGSRGRSPPTSPAAASDTTDRLAPRTFTIGNVESLAEIGRRGRPAAVPRARHRDRHPIDRGRPHRRAGPPTGGGCIGPTRPTAMPPASSSRCVGTSDFIDCDGRTIDVARTVASRRRRVPDRAQNRTHADHRPARRHASTTR